MVFTKLRVRDPHMLMWVRIMACTGAGRGKVKFGSPFFRWLSDQILIVEDYSYASTDFRGDPDLLLLPSRQWGDMGKKQNPKIDICVFCLLMLFYFLCIVTRPKIFMQM